MPKNKRKSRFAEEFQSHLGEMEIVRANWRELDRMERETVDRMERDNLQKIRQELRQNCDKSA